MGHEKETQFLEKCRNTVYLTLAATDLIVGASGFYAIFSEVLGATTENARTASTIFLFSFPTSVLLCGIIFELNREIAQLKDQNGN